MTSTLAAARRSRRLATLALLLLAACGRSEAPSAAAGGAGPLPPDAAAKQCHNDQLSEADILAVTRDPAELPLQDLSHYQARRAARDPAAALNGGGCEGNRSFRYAAGRGDITGPIGANMAGYVDAEQIATGLLDRQYARAFVFHSSCGGREGRAALVQLDLGLAFHAVRQGVLDRLAGDPELGPLYHHGNLMLNASHSHSTAAGQSHFDGYHALTNGHDAQAYEAAVSGIVTALQRAHENLEGAAPGPILFNQGELLNGTVNRSIEPYQRNPEAERQAFVDTAGNEVATNRMMSLIRLERDDGRAVGTLNWYAIHGTSIYKRNTLLAGDNKGYAAQRFEADFAGTDFLAGFIQGDEGDASPNLFITDLTVAEQRDYESAAYRNRAGGRSEPENALISGYKQYRRARELYEGATEALQGEVAAGSIFIDFSNVTVESPPEYPAELQPGSEGYVTCKSALGVSFGAGAEDGRAPAAEGQSCFDVTEADVARIAAELEENFGHLTQGGLPPGLIVPVGCDNPAWDERGYACHAEKPILFPVAESSPFGTGQPFEPQVQPLQIVVLGNLAIVGLPWEVTTMSGRRLRQAVGNALAGAGVDYVLVNGLSNGFIHYLTTREEYAEQHYEGASNVYGPWTLDAVTQELLRLAGHLVAGTPPDSPYAVAEFRSQLSSFQNPMAADDGLMPGSFGAVVQQPAARYTMGEEAVVVSARFIGGHPRHDMRLEDSLLFIERQLPDESWETVATDAHWFTRFDYQQGQDDGSNHAVVDWIVPPDTAPGTYRIRHQGASADGPYTGVSSSFELRPCP